MDTILLEGLIYEVKCMNNELKDIKEDILRLEKRVIELQDNTKQANKILSEHIGFVDNQYKRYKSSLDFVRDKVNYLNPLSYFNVPKITE
jgi:hypothetical protein